MKKIGLIIAIVEVCVAAVLLAITIKNTLTLPSATDGEVYRIFDTREDYYPLTFTWAILLIAGLLYWKNKKWHWVLTQFILIPLALLYSFFPLAVEDSDWLKVLYFTLYIAVVALAGWFFYRKNYLEINGITAKLMLLTVFAGIFFFFIFSIGWVAIYDTLIV